MARSRLASASASLPAARFFGVANEIAGHVRHGTFAPASGRGHVATDVPDGPATAVTRPESLGLEAIDDAGPTWDGLSLPGVVRDARFAGTHVDVTVVTDDGVPLHVHVPVGTPVQPGAPMNVTAPERVTVVFATEPSQ